MNREKLYDRIMLEHRNLIQIHKKLYEAQHLPVGAALDEVADLLTDAALLAEKTTCRLRNLLFDTAPTPRPEYFSRAAVEQGVSVSYQDGILFVRLPRLLPKKRQKSSAAFLLPSLQAALDGFCKMYPFPVWSASSMSMTQHFPTDRCGTMTTCSSSRCWTWSPSMPCRTTAGHSATSTRLPAWNVNHVPA